MKITGFANSLPGESPSHSRTEAIEPPPADIKVKEVTAGNSPNNNSLKQGLARVFEKIKFAHVPPIPNSEHQPPPNPYERGDRRKKAVAKYRRVNETDEKVGQKLNRAA